MGSFLFRNKLQIWNRIETVPATVVEFNASMTLTSAPLNTALVITEINAGREAHSRLSSMGILPGKRIKIMRRDSRGPLLLDVSGSRVAVGRGLSEKVIVTVE